MPNGLPPGHSDANNEWVLDFCRFRSAWTKTKGAGITIAHADTGWTLHPELDTPNVHRSSDLSRNFWEPIHLHRKSATWTSQDDLTGGTFSTGHGTGTLGVIVSPQGRPDGFNPGADAATAENTPEAFMSGAAPDATVIPFRVTDDPVIFDNGDAALAQCIYFCIGLRKRGTDVAVISASLGGTNIFTEQAIKRALREAREAGIIVVAAGGQFFASRPKFLIPEDAGNPSFPGSSPDTICAAACEYDAEPLEGGFYGEEVDITAPGFNVWVPKSTLNSANGASSSSSSGGGDGGNVSPSSTERHVVHRSDGTSYATALTAAACALWQSCHGREFLLRKYKYGDRSKLFSAFKACLCLSADVPAGFDTSQRGAGILNVERLLDEKLPDPEDIPLAPDAGCASIIQWIRNPPILPRPE